jgi:hypothetical protein
MTIRTLTRNGRTGRPLHDPGIVAPKIIKLDAPLSSVICNASAPRAPVGYRWPHLAKSVRTGK